MNLVEAAITNGKGLKKAIEKQSGCKARKPVLREANGEETTTRARITEKFGHFYRKPCKDESN